MVTIADGAGTINIATSDGEQEVNFSFDVKTEEVLEHTGRGRMVVAQAAVADVVPIGNIANVSFIWLKAVRSTDETVAANMEAVKLTTGAGVKALGPTHAMLLITNPRADEDISAISIDGHADYDIVVEYTVAGRA